jgi:hypothetical protein
MVLGVALNADKRAAPCVNVEDGAAQLTVPRMPAIAAWLVSGAFRAFAAWPASSNCGRALPTRAGHLGTS